MPDLSSVSFLTLGFLLGVKHALEADHLVAISTVATQNRNLWRSCMLGACWGVGHTLVLLLAGLGVLVFRLTISDEWAKLLEAGVGVMLIGLGVSVGRALWRERWHVHSHTHADGIDHLHVHSHRDGQQHTHLHRFRLEYKSLAIGMMHGLAGSAAALLLVLSTAHSLAEGLGYLLIFGTGSITGMSLLGVVLSVPFACTPGNFVRTHQALRTLACLASVTLGGVMVYGFLATGGLHWTFFPSPDGRYHIP